jgi:ABC-type cobalamin/Fe3+-siderophores transport system ATPase subunit
MNKISNWNMWDLHFHLNNSISDKVTYPEGYNEKNIYEYISNKFEKERISLVVITDHMHFDKESYEALKKSCTNVSIIPGMEVNVKLDKKEKYVQILIAVDPDNIDKLVEMSNYIDENKSLKKGNASNFCLNMDEFVKLISVMDVTMYWEYGKARGFDKKSCPNDDLEDISNYMKYGFLRNYNMTKKPNNIAKMRNELNDYLIDSTGENRKEIVSDAILFTASDSHSFYEDLKTVPWQRTWFKALPTYKGIKMAFTDKERVYVNETTEIENPSEIQNINWIESVEFNINNEFKKIYFSKYLNSVIGSRGMGKSLLLKILNNKIENDKNSNVVIRDIKINWKNNEGTKTLSYYDQNSFIAIGVEQKEELARRIEEKADETSSDVELNNFKDAEDIIKDWKEILDNLNLIHTKLGQKYLGELMGYYYDNPDKLKTKNENNFSKFFNIKNLLELERSRFSTISKSAESLKTKIEVVDIEFKKMIEDIEKIEFNFLIKNSFPINIFADEAMKNIDRGIEQLNRGVWYIADNINNIDKIEVNVNSKNNYYNQIIEIFDLKKSQTLINWMDISKCLWKSYDLRKKINQDLKISSFNSVKKSNYNVNGQKVVVEKITKYTNDENIIDVLWKASFKSGNDKVNWDIFINVEQLLNSLKKSYLSNLELKKILGPEEFDLKIRVGGNEFDAESPGKRAEILLTLFLNDTDTKPLIIDQPEDNLDNHYISKYLCTKIKKIKERRQVICVSHNANIVINCDSENVITVENKDNDFDFHYGAIEYEDNIRDIADYLEGGIEALKSRAIKISTFKGEKQWK